jgi:Prokaryotic N-terminal methylation motif
MKTMNRPTAIRRRHSRTQSTGFTLIEVLVTLALTMIMMLLFAQIFQIAGNFVTRQKGIGENDQSARILTTVLKTDLEARSMRYLAPFHPNMSAFPDDTNRQGYFYVSENNPMDDADDILQFTVSLNTANFLATANPARGTQLSGLATNLPLPWQPNTTYVAGAYVRPAATTSTSQPTGFIYQTTGGLTSGATEPSWDSATLTIGTTVSDSGGGTWTTAASATDQPDGDDGVMTYLAQPQVPAASAGIETINPPGAGPNNTGASQFAEIAYFLRHGNLYRRVLLIRSPYNSAISPNSSQPVDTVGNPLVPGTYPPPPTTAYANTFWGDFDYAARSLPIATGGTGVAFLGTTSNEFSLGNNGTGTYEIGRPDNRFGFDQVYNIPPGTASGTQTYNGVPREFALLYNAPPTNTYASATPVYFGRYTDEETSNTNFLFPGALPLMPPITGTPTSPMGSASVLGLDSNSYTMWLLNGTPPTAPTASLPFAKGPRRGEDILLTNVVSFDVKLWDNHYSEVASGYDVNRNGIIDSGPAFADIGHGATGDFQQSKNALPVYGPNILTGYTVPATGSNSWSPAYTNPSNTYISNIPAPNTVYNYNYNNVFDTWYRYFNFDNLPRTYDQFDPPPPPPTPVPPNLYAPAPYRPRLGVQWQPNTAYALGAMVDPVNTANGYVYVCSQAGTSGAAPPAGQPDPFSLSDPAGLLILSGTPPGTDGTAMWKAQAPVAVQAIQITVKYLDPSQNLLRQVTIIESLAQ